MTLLEKVFLAQSRFLLARAMGDKDAVEWERSYRELKKEWERVKKRPSPVDELYNATQR